MPERPQVVIVMTFPEIETERLLLRQLREDDLDLYHTRIFGDPDVMRYLPAGKPVPRERTQAMMARFKEHWEQHQFGVWAVVDKSQDELIGHCGLQWLTETPEVEVLYALAKPYWGHGLATEAARASVRFGFEQVKLDRIIALAMPANLGSRRVMEHIGLKYEKDARFFNLDVVYYAIQRDAFHVDSHIYRLR